MGASVSSLSDGELYQEIGKIVANFDLLECYECAQAVIEFLQINDIKYKILRLKTRYSDEDFVVSDRLMSRGINDSITINGKHYGIEIQGLVFDNLSVDGMTREDWLNDFHCPSEQFEIKELESL